MSDSTFDYEKLSRREKRIWYRGYRDGLIAAQYCPECEDEARLCGFDPDTGLCEYSIEEMEWEQ